MPVYVEQKIPAVALEKVDVVSVAPSVLADPELPAFQHQAIKHRQEYARPLSMAGSMALSHITT